MVLPLVNYAAVWLVAPLAQLREQSEDSDQVASKHFVCHRDSHANAARLLGGSRSCRIKPSFAAIHRMPRDRRFAEL
jgi:hypothetical protein